MLVVAALYKFVTLEDYKDLQEPLKKFCDQQNIKGTLLLAFEGINGTVAGTREAINNLRTYFDQDARFYDLEYKESSAETYPFYRMKVRVKKEIVTLGIPGVNPAEEAGTYVDPQEWNALINDPEVILVDTRNDYEVEIGTFKGAINPATTTFTEFPEYVKANLDPQRHKKVAMFCTGGIRCEKASSYMLKQGFEKVYHLKGGILKYLEVVPQEESLWEGECFVFDQRVAVTQGLQFGEHTICHGCRKPLSAQDRESAYFEEGISCPYCHDSLTPERRKALSDRQRQVELAAKRNQMHIGASRKSI